MSTIEGGSIINTKKFLEFAGTTIGQVPYYIRTSPAAAPLLCDARNLCVTFFPAKTGFQGWIFVVGHSLSIATVRSIEVKVSSKASGECQYSWTRLMSNPGRNCKRGGHNCGGADTHLAAGAVGAMRGRALRLKWLFSALDYFAISMPHSTLVTTFKF